MGTAQHFVFRAKTDEIHKLNVVRLHATNTFTMTIKVEI
jgi:hypothetical protein